MEAVLPIYEQSIIGAFYNDCLVAALEVVLKLNLQTLAMLKTLARAAEASERAGTRRPITPLEEPWAGFFAEATEAVESIVVSHRANRGLKGALHEETNYSRQRDGGSGERRTKRKALDALSSQDLDRIADPVIKDVVT